MSFQQFLVVLALARWALCGATMEIALARTSQRRAILIHGVAAPLIFAVTSAIYFGRFGYTAPLSTAVGFVAVVIAMDVFVVALLIRHDFSMFGSVPGTWVPFASIFVSTYLVGFLSGR